jgi:hypothetical protein
MPQDRAPWGQANRRISRRHRPQLLFLLDGGRTWSLDLDPGYLTAITRPEHDADANPLQATTLSRSIAMPARRLSVVKAAGREDADS